MAFVGGEGVEEVSDPSPRGFDAALISLAEEGFELGDDHFDGVQVGAVGRQKQQVCPCVSDQFPGGQPFVTPKIVSDDNIAGGQCRHEALADPGGEGVTVDRPVQMSTAE